MLKTLDAMPKKLTIKLENLLKYSYLATSHFITTFMPRLTVKRNKLLAIPFYKALVDHEIYEKTLPALPIHS